MLKKPEAGFTFFKKGVKIFVILEVVGIGVSYFFWNRMNTSEGELFSHSPTTRPLLGYLSHNFHFKVAQIIANFHQNNNKSCCFRVQIVHAQELPCNSRRLLHNWRNFVGRVQSKGY